jgi:hypothetical protein
MQCKQLELLQTIIEIDNTAHPIVVIRVGSHTRITQPFKPTSYRTGVDTTTGGSSTSHSTRVPGALHARINLLFPFVPKAILKALPRLI